MQIDINYLKDLALSSKSKEKIIFFDLDSTIYDLTNRQATILKEFSKAYLGEGDFSPIAQRIIAADFQRFPFYAEDALKEKGIPIHPVFKKYFYAFWYERFFSNEYVAHDLLEDGILEFVEWLVDRDIKVVYLTGRDMPRMGEGTQQKLLRDGLLQKGEQLLLKPNSSMIDKEYKLDMVRSYFAEGKQVMFIDNEASNSNYIWQHMPDVINVFYDTVHSGSEEPNENLFVLSSFIHK